MTIPPYFGIKIILALNGYKYSTVLRINLRID